MCGRFTLTIDSGFRDRYHLNSLPSTLAPKYSAYPGADVPVIFLNNSQNNIDIKNWGLGVYKSFNARVETILEKPTFKDAFENSRCLVPVNGFFEAKKFFSLQNEDLFSLAGIYDGGQFTVLTTEPNDQVRPYHHRMPVIIPRDQEFFYLSAPTPSLSNLLLPSVLSLLVH